MNTVRHNWAAIAVATLVYFMLGGVWFTLLKNPWLAGVGRTVEEIQATGVSPAVTYGSAVVTTFLIALFLSWVIQATGSQTLAGGLKVAAWTWLGVVFATWSTEYAFEARSLQALAINTGYCLTGMLLMGAILGGWKRRLS
jgi:Protein of unknown function (DUF1761)